MVIVYITMWRPWSAILKWFKMMKVFFDISKKSRRQGCLQTDRKGCQRYRYKGSKNQWKGAEDVGSKTGQLFGEKLYDKFNTPKQPIQNTRDRTQEMLNSTNKTQVFISVLKKIKGKKSSNLCKHKQRTRKWHNQKSFQINIFCLHKSLINWLTCECYVILLHKWV